MPIIDLKYGRGKIPFSYDSETFQVIRAADDASPLADAELGEKLDQPIASPPLEDVVSPGDSVLIVVPDATRQTGCGQVVNLIVRRLIANGSAPHEMRIVFATGIHRKVTEDEKHSILTPFIAQRIKTLDHDPRDLMQLIKLGETSSGIPVELNRAVVEHDKIIVVGGAAFHYFAGFTGGRKLVCPGLASSRTVLATHRLAFDCSKMSRRDGVGTGRLSGNAVHEAFMEVVGFAPPAFAITTIVNDRGEVTDLFCGDWKRSHEAACEAYQAKSTVQIREKHDLVVVSSGGFPYDINLIQAHKALEAASHACVEGGTIIFLAECTDGTGREDFLKWFDADSKAKMAARMCEKYQVNGQTAWSLLDKAERFNIKIVTSLAAETTQKMRLEKVEAASLDEFSFQGRSGYIFPAASRCRVALNP